MFQFDRCGALLRTDLPFPRHSGKVRDVYDLGDHFLIVSTDRISAFDFILPSGIPDKGRVLTAMSEFWFGRLKDIEHHWLSGEVPPGLVREPIDPGPLLGRVMLVRKATVVPFECVVRGYLEGSGWKEYLQTGSVCGNGLPTGLRQCDRLPEPIFTPTTKSQHGHDQGVTWQMMADAIGTEMATRLKSTSLQIFAEASRYAEEKGVLIADTKFEFGQTDDALLLIDEVLTPDSSRFWPADDYQPGRAQKSFDKQFVREWLLASDWDQISPPPPLPVEIVVKTREKYLEAYQRLTGERVPSVAPDDESPV